jgi:uncharacterized protein YecT (DUF1311 family)
LARILLSCLLLAPLPAQADNHRPEDWPEGSAMHLGRTAQIELAAADARLNAVYRQLMDSLPADGDDDHPRRTLRAAQRAWIAFRDAECALVGEARGGMRMWKSALDTQCQAQLTQARAARLEELLPGRDE